MKTKMLIETPKGERIEQFTHHGAIAYWSNPTDEENKPEKYFSGKEKSEFVCGLIDEFSYFSEDRDICILELGCSVGRNLEALFNHGYRNLSGVEVNEQAVLLSLSSKSVGITIHLQTIEEFIKTVPDNTYDVVFTMAVLEHIPWESDWIFKEIERIVRDTLITIENEQSLTERHFPRNYRRVFRGLTQIEKRSCDEVPDLGKKFVARIFRKNPK